MLNAQQSNTTAHFDIDIGKLAACRVDDFG
jgi:hypothetical protein